MKKKLSVLMLMVLVIAICAGIVGAQDRPGGRGGNRPGPRNAGLLLEYVDIVEEQTGLTALELRQQMAEGKTLEQIITENGGNVDEVIAAIVTATTERINQAVTDGRLTHERADEMLGNLEENVRNVITTGAMPFPDRPGAVRSVIELSQILLEQAELDVQQVREALAAGQTIGDLIEAAGKDVDTVIADTITAATAKINEAVTAGNLTQERADEMLSNLETAITNLVNSAGLIERAGEEIRSRPLVNAVAEATGLTPVEVAQEIRDGKSLASILTEKNINVETFIDEQLAPVQERLDRSVANETLSQAVADARLNLRRVELTDALNQTLGEPVQPAGADA